MGTNMFTPPHMFPYLCQVGTVRRAMVSPRAKLQGMLWVQGECDGLEEDVARLYAENFKKFIAAARADLSQLNPK